MQRTASDTPPDHATQPFRGARVVLLLAGALAATAHAQATQTPETASAPVELVDVPHNPDLPEPLPRRDDAEPAAPGEEDEPGRLRFNLSVDVTNRYFFRGIVQERSGFIVQPAASLAVDVVRSDWTLQAVVGTWNSYHDTGTNSTSTDDFIRRWYEADIYGGVVVGAGAWTGRAIYTFYTSPSDAFETVQDLSLAVSYDDSEHLGAFALRPTLTLVIETGSNFADGADSDRGIYLEPSIAPGFTLEDGVGGLFKGTSVTFPIAVGLSLSDYYQDANGDDDTFGYVSAGAKAAVPLGLPEGWGDWTLTLGVQGLFLGDNTSEFNGGRDEEFIMTFGLAISY